MKTSNPIPPRLAKNLLRSFLRDDLAEEVTGDLEEKFFVTVRTRSVLRARLHYWFQVFNYLRPFAIRKPKSTTQNHYPMFQSYFKIGWRNLLRSKAYSMINITGLAIGLTCAMAIGLFIWDEYSYDRFHQNAKYIYRVVQQQNQAGELYDVAASPGPLGTALKADFPEVVDACLTGYKRSGILQQGQVTVESSAIMMADHRFFQMFDFPLVLGNPEKVLSEPNQMIITEQMASNLFGRDWRMNGDLLGKSILLDKGKELILVGIAKDLPTNSHIQFEVMFAYDPGDRENHWGSNNYHTYVQLDAKADPGPMKEKLSHYITKYLPSSKTTFSLQPLTDIYLHSDFDFRTDWSKTSSILYIRVFLAVGAVVLLIALFNFINLSTARAMRRAKEVGIRKTVGAFYRQLMTQFLCESLLMTTISVVLALALLFFALPLLNGLASKSLFVPFNEPRFVIAIIAFTIVMSVLSGLYPSVYLSNFQPIKVLKGVFDVHSGHRFRQILVVCQFTFSVVLAVGAIVIYQQLSYLQDKNLGFDQSQLIYLKTRNMPTKSNIVLKHELKKQSSIVDAASASNSLVDNINSTLGFEWEGQAAGDIFLITLLNIDPDYIGTTGMKLVAGRDFDYGITADTASCMINETAARRMGWTSEGALGKWFDIRNRKGTIVGVVQDFHFRPMTAAIEPLVFIYRPDRSYDGIMVKTNPKVVREAIATIERLYKNHEPNIAAHYTFLDEQLEAQYRHEQRTGKIVLYFSLLAIFVACLGLYGLAAFTAERRTKEIGLRKVMGASISSITTLLSRDFLKLVLISFMVATPLSYLLMSKWLQGFVYRINMEWWVFLLAGVLAILIAFLTVSYQAIRAAMMNPVNSLRSE